MAFNFFKGLSRSGLLSDTYDHCIELLENSRCKHLPFHSIEHTREVYRYSKTIAQYEEVYGSDLDPILIAALFHDTGMAETYIDHEEQSVVYAKAFLEKMNYSHKKIQIVEDCILATKMPQAPKTKAQKIICDADLYHLGIESYLFKNERLRAEWETFFNRSYTDEEWFKMNMDFLKKQKYHTWFGKTVLNNRKDMNYKVLKERHAKYKI